MTPFYFLRHGQTDWNSVGRLQGKGSDIPLNTIGLQQAHSAGQKLARHHIDQIVSSPLERARMTADVVSQYVHAPIAYDQHLLERDCGSIEGLTVADIESSDPGSLFDLTVPKDWMGFTHPRGAESLDALGERAYAAVETILAAYSEQKLLLVGHGGWFRSFVYLASKQKLILRSENAVPYFCRLGAGENGSHITINELQ